VVASCIAAHGAEGTGSWSSTARTFVGVRGTDSSDGGY
jgi:hypothetical protein